MKVLLVLLFLSSSGDIDNAMVVSSSPSVIVCQEQAAFIIEKMRTDHAFPDNVTPMPVCIDATKLGTMHVPDVSKKTEL